MDDELWDIILGWVALIAAGLLCAAVFIGMLVIIVLNRYMPN